MDNWETGIEGLAYAPSKPADDNHGDASIIYQDQINGNVRLSTEDAERNRMVRCSSGGGQKRTTTRNGFEYTLKPSSCVDAFEYVDSDDEEQQRRTPPGSDVVENAPDGDVVVYKPVTSLAARVIFCNHIVTGGGASEVGGTAVGSQNDCACCLPRVGECEDLVNCNNAELDARKVRRAPSRSGEGDDRRDRLAVATWTSDASAAGVRCKPHAGRDGQDVYCKTHYGYGADSEPIHMTLEEVKDSLKRLYKNSEALRSDAANKLAANGKEGAPFTEKSASKGNVRKGPFHIHLRHKKSRSGDCDHDKRGQHRKSLPSSIRQTFCSLFGGGSKKSASSKPSCARGHSKSHEELSCSDVDSNLLNTPSRSIPSLSPFTNRALPPLPTTAGMEDNPDDRLYNDAEPDQANGDHEPVDFATSIRQVKDYGWYWGPISGEMAEKILVGEPDGSFIVRDSSDNHYIFSLTFKLNGFVRHVRIEHDQGNFSFGTFTNFKSQTIVEFIENAVKHSRSGRYLFFLHRRPMLGPMRVQLLHPVSRFKQVQSLQHRCRFVILKVVRWDLVDQLTLPKKLKDYLKTPQYYTEEVDFARGEDLAGIVLPATTPEQHIVLGELPR